jgi:hypothetical protein
LNKRGRAANKKNHVKNTLVNESEANVNLFDDKNES